jgi:hypothetical protein
MELNKLIERLQDIERIATDKDMDVKINGNDIDRIEYSMATDSNDIVEEFVCIVSITNQHLRGPQ